MSQMKGAIFLTTTDSDAHAQSRQDALVHVLKYSTNEDSPLRTDKTHRRQTNRTHDSDTRKDPLMFTPLALACFTSYSKHRRGHMAATIWSQDALTRGRCCCTARMTRDTPSLSPFTRRRQGCAPRHVRAVVAGSAGRRASAPCQCRSRKSTRRPTPCPGRPGSRQPAFAVGSAATGWA